MRDYAPKNAHKKIPITYSVDGDQREEFNAFASKLAYI